MEYGLAGRRALITGGSHGIGLACADILAMDGVSVAVCSRSEERLAAAKTMLERHGRDVPTYVFDALNRNDVDDVCRWIDKLWGGVDILINNVGGGGRWGQPTVEATAPEVWDEVYQKNAGAAISFTRWAIPAMRRAKWGRVVTIASIYGREGGGRAWFNLAKAAEISLMKSLAMMPDLVRDGLTFNTVAPGSIQIPDTGWAEEAARDPVGHARKLDAFPLGRLGTPEEVAHVVAFLCSPLASLVNGACIPVDGGEGRSF